MCLCYFSVILPNKMVCTKCRYCFAELGVRFRYIPAVDGKTLNADLAKSMGITQLSEYRDPYKGRNLTFGEIGCFLSHRNVWIDIIQQGYQEAIVFEDDIHFVPYFRQRFDIEIQILHLFVLQI